MFADLKRIFSLAWNVDRRLVVFYYLAGAIGALAPLGAGIALKYLIDTVLARDYGLHESLPTIVVVILAARYLIQAAEALFSQVLNATYLDFLFRYKLQNALNLHFYRKLAELDVGHLEDPETQNLITKAKDTFPWRVPDFLRVTSYASSSFVGYTAAFIVLLPFEWWVPFLITAAAVPRMCIEAKHGHFQWSIYGCGAPQVKKLWYFMWILSWPTTIKEMRIFQSHQALLKRFEDIQLYLYKLNKKPLDRYLRFLLLPLTLEIGLLLGLACLKVPAVLSGALSLGSFTLFITMIEQLSSSSGRTVRNCGILYEDVLYIRYYFDVLSLPRLIAIPKEPFVFDKICPPHIEFRNVSFSYPNGTSVLHDVSFAIEPTESLAIIGPNGAGKSTIIKLLCRFYDVSSGEILINGKNLKDIDTTHWYKFLGTLFQDFVQFNFTVSDNITLGNPENRDPELMVRAAQWSGAADFIEKLPHKYDQMLGRHFEDGEELSIGQWQKIAIARAFYLQAPVLVMDEPTSAVDAEAEYEIFSNLEQVYQDKTVVFVSHRFSTVRNAQKIIVLQDGRITESGTHDQLLALNAKYAHMFRLQAKGYEITSS